jgi:hypothetical protein
VTVTRDGRPEPARLVPVASDELAVALVVDTSAAGAATLPAWLSAAARFILEAPSRTQAVVIADSAPAAAITEPQRGPMEIIRSLDGVRAQGRRDTAAALDLAGRQFPATPVGRRVVVFYTSAPDAGGESAARLGARFRDAGTLLVVVGTAAANRFWTEAAAATGGFFAPAGDPVVVPALDQVRATLGARYLVQFPTPPTLPARVSVRVDTGDLTLTADAVVVPAPERDGVPDWVPRAVALGLLATGLAVAAVLLLVRRRRSGRAAARAPAVPEPEQDQQRRPAGAAGAAPPVARGRVAVHPAVARGRAAVPAPGPPDRGDESE